MKITNFLVAAALAISAVSALPASTDPTPLPHVHKGVVNSHSPIKHGHHTITSTTEKKGILGDGILPYVVHSMGIVVGKVHSFYRHILERGVSERDDPKKDVKLLGPFSCDHHPDHPLCSSANKKPWLQPPQNRYHRVLKASHHMSDRPNWSEKREQDAVPFNYNRESRLELKVEELQGIIAEKDHKIGELEQRINDLEHPSHPKDQGLEPDNTIIEVIKFDELDLHNQPEKQLEKRGGNPPPLEPDHRIDEVLKMAEHDFHNQPEIQQEKGGDNSPSPSSFKLPKADLTRAVTGACLNTLMTRPTWCPKLLKTGYIDADEFFLEFVKQTPKGMVYVATPEAASGAGPMNLRVEEMKFLLQAHCLETKDSPACRQFLRDGKGGFAVEIVEG
jgi:hypothetical protein